MPDRLGRDSDGHDTLPVYRAENSSSDAVATGTLMAQFDSSVTPDARREALEAAGFELVRTAVYAPNAAWVRARDKSAAESLHQIERLNALPGVKSVEPELLRPRSLRTE